MVVGEGRAGKTSTVTALLRRPFNPTQESTQGVDLKKINVSDWDEHEVTQFVVEHLMQVFHPTESFGVVSHDEESNDETNGKSVQVSAGKSETNLPEVPQQQQVRPSVCTFHVSLELIGGAIRISCSKHRWFELNKRRETAQRAQPLVIVSET